MKATRCHFPLSVETCKRTAPVVKSELSASIQNGFVKSGEMRTGAEVTLSFSLSIEVSKPQKGLHLLLIRWGRPIPNASNLDQVHCYRVVQDNHSEVLNCGLFELTLAC